MRRLVPILALWLTLLVQAGLGVAPQGASVWVLCTSADCAATTVAAEDRGCGGCCCEHEDERPAPPVHGGTVGVPPPCCVVLVFPGSRGQPPARALDDALPTVNGLFAPPAPLVLPPTPPVDAGLAGHLEDGRPPPRAGLSVTSRLRL